VWSRIFGADASLPSQSWSTRGAAEMRRTLADGSIELFVCLPERLDGELAPELERAGFRQDPDVLDTWFSSALWPLSTLGWPDPARFEMQGLLDAFNPSAVLSTAREIITLWVSRMVMFNRHFLGGRLPFRDVFIHSIVQDGFGQKMSKSLANGVDPRDIIATHGADAMRFVLVQMSTGTQDVRLPVDVLCPHTGKAFTPTMTKTDSGHVVAAPTQPCPTDPTRAMVTGYGVASGLAQPTEAMPLARNTSSRFDIGRNFATKVWNASRFALAQCGDGSVVMHADAAQATAVVPTRLIDRWILHRFAHLMRTVDGAIDAYQFNPVAEALYDFIWRDFCDWYLEGIKPTVKGDAVQQAVLRCVLDGTLRVLHPVMPFVTEALWPPVAAVRARTVAALDLPPSLLAATARWPRCGDALTDNGAAQEFGRVQSLVEAIRNLRGERKVLDRRRINLHVTPAIASLVAQADGTVETLAGIGTVESSSQPRPVDAVAFPFEGEELLLSSLVDIVDVASERTRLEQVVRDRQRAIAGFEGKLSNAGYVAKAKPEVVEQTRRMLAEAQADLIAAQRALDAVMARA
jgi:valyl-tRNA synthetase